jgi:nicotinamide mononucleotide (NMN) deamidase PncC
LSSCSFKPSSFSPSLLLLLSDGTKQRRSVSLQEAKRMLADIVSQCRATAAIGGCAGAAGPSTQLPS